LVITRRNVNTVVGCDQYPKWCSGCATPARTKQIIAPVVPTVLVERAKSALTDDASGET
jgi:hypothetical protein